MGRSLLGILGTFRDEGFTYGYARPGGVVGCGHCHAAPGGTLELHRLERLEATPIRRSARGLRSRARAAASGAHSSLTFGPESTREDDEVLSSSTTPAGSNPDRSGPADVPYNT
jgi:hypothetical protein